MWRNEITNYLIKGSSVREAAAKTLSLTKMSKNSPVSLGVLCRLRGMVEIDVRAVISPDLIFRRLTSSMTASAILLSCAMLVTFGLHCILSEIHIKHMMQAVFDSPMISYGTLYITDDVWTMRTQRSEVVTRLRRCCLSILVVVYRIVLSSFGLLHSSLCLTIQPNSKPYQRLRVF